MTLLKFYLTYAARNLTRSGRWTIFAVFCVAAGVATVVALRSLGLAIADSLVANARSSNHGDITLELGSSMPFSDFDPDQRGRRSFTESEVNAVRRWAEDNGAKLTAYRANGNFQVTTVGATTVGRPQFVSAFLIDPQTFPPTEDITALDPAGVPLRDLFGGGNEIIVSVNLAQTQNIKVGDTVRVSGTDEPFTVVGIVPTELEAGIRNPFASFFGFAYLPLDKAELLQLSPEPNTISLALPEGADIDAAGKALQARVTRRAEITTLPELLARNARIGDVMGRFIVVMGLGALLIGGVGIINTMLVMVGRRTTEIAALKTFGLKGKQVAALFLAEAFLLGLAGSVVGCVFGVLMSGAVNQYGEAFLQQRLVWRLYPEAIVYGLGLGLVVTMVFGVLPVLTANRIRPAVILRPNETVIPAAGCLQSLIALLAVVFIIGGAAGGILGSIPFGMIGVALTLLILGILVGMLWVVIWLVSHFPSFGSVDLRLALRSLTARRLRTATTLLALVGGMAALSSIVFVGAGARELLNFELTQKLGGNVLVFPSVSLLSPTIGQATFNAQVGRLQGIERVTTLEFYDLKLLAVNGEPPRFNVPAFVEENIPEAEREDIRDLSFSVMSQNVTADTPPPDMSAGRPLTPEDAGKQVIVVRNKSAISLNIQLGAILTLRVGNRRMDFEVVGLVSDTNGMSPNSFNAVPAGALGGASPSFTFNVLDIAPEKLNETLLAFQPPFFFSLDITFIDSLLTRLIAQFSAIPTLVGLLSLLAAAVIMANTVSLATLERRRQIGILKSIGLKGKRVLLIMLVENTIVGLLGGLIGVGVSAAAVAIMNAVNQADLLPVPRDAAPTAVALILASVVIAWIATFASAQVAIGERVTNVLRYE